MAVIALGKDSALASDKDSTGIALTDVSDLAYGRDDADRAIGMVSDLANDNDGTSLRSVSDLANDTDTGILIIKDTKVKTTTTAGKWKKTDMTANNTNIIMIGVFKGGVGKTTTAINLGHALALQKKRVLLIDLDPQGNATRALGYEVTDHTPTVYTVMKGISKASESIGEVRDNLYLLPSNRTTALLETELASELGREKTLKRAMKGIDDFDFVLLDCGPGSTIVNVNALVYATDVLMPIEIGVDSVEGVEDFIAAKDAICQKLEIDTRLMGAVMTKVDRRLTLTETILNHCSASFQGKFFAQIRTDTNLGHARGHRQTIFEFDPRSRSAEDFNNMAKAVTRWFRRTKANVS